MARLFPPDDPSIPLELLRAQTLKTGVLNLSYSRAQTAYPYLEALRMLRLKARILRRSSAAAR